MAVALTVNGNVYQFPEVSDQNWAAEVTAWATAVSQACLQKTGGGFTLTADVNFGANFGLISTYFKSRTSSPAQSGAMRLAVSDSVSWRNNTNTGDLPLGISALDTLQFGGADIAMKADQDAIDARLSAAEGDIDSLESVTGSQGSRLTTAESDIGTLQSDVTSLDSRLSTAESDITTLSGLDVGTTKGDLIAKTASGYARQSVGGNGQVLSADSAQTTGLAWVSPLTNPMTATGDIIVGGTSGAATRLAKGTDGQWLKQVSGTPAWTTLSTPLKGTGTNDDAAAGDVGEYLSQTFAIAPSAGNWGTGTGITLTAGDWDLTLTCAGDAIASLTFIAAGVSTDSSSSSYSDQSTSDPNWIQTSATSVTTTSLCMSGYRVKVASGNTATYYPKVRPSGNSTTIRGKISARRAR